MIELADEDKIDEESSPDIEELPVIQEQQIFAIDNSYQLEFTFDGIPKINICVLPSVEPLKSSPALLEEFESPEKVSCFSLLSPERVLEKSIEEKQNNLISILKKVSDNLVKSPVKKKSVNFILPNPTPTRSSSRLNNKAKQIGHDFVLTQKFFIIVENFFSNYVKNLKFRSDPHPVLLRIFNWTKTIDIYGKLLQKSLMMSKKRQNESTAEASTKTKKNMSTSEEYSKKLHRKIADNRNLIMQTSRNKCTIEKDCSYAYNYLERAKKTMTENGDDELYSEFMTMLTSFDPEFESVPELYNVSLNFTDC